MFGQGRNLIFLGDPIKCLNERTEIELFPSMDGNDTLCFENVITEKICSIFVRKYFPGSNFFGETPLFFRYSGVNAANAVNLIAKRR